MPPPEQLGSPTSPYQRLTATSQSNSIEADHLDDRPSHEESSVSDADSDSYSSNDYNDEDDDDDKRTKMRKKMILPSHLKKSCTVAPGIKQSSSPSPSP